MQFTVVLLQGDPRVATALSSELSNFFHAVQQVESMDELWNSVAKQRARVAILDMETASIADVERLSREFPGACIVCTHRLADEELWAAALKAGAADVYLSSDTRGILSAVLGGVTMIRSAAA
jgi:DNA-binding NarL/FixJ family response regulator